MSATDERIERASRLGLAERDVRALTEYMTVLGEVGRARDAEDLYLVVSASGREYLVDAREGSCECDDHRFRDERCKHVRRVEFATGRRAIPVDAAVELDVDPDLGRHVEGERRYVATDGGVGRLDHDDGAGGDRSGDAPGEETGDTADDAAGETPDERAGEGADAVAEDGGPWTVRDRRRGKRREFEDRASAEAALADLEDLGADVELLPPSASAAEGAQQTLAEASAADVEPADVESAAVEPDAVEPAERRLAERGLADDPMTLLPDAFVDEIDGTPAINRKGFEVLAHFYDVDVEASVQVGPAETDFEYCQVKATATTPDGRRCQALGSAHIDRDDDPTLLLELADTRARKRAISVATGVGIVAVEELQSQVEADR